MDEGSRTSSSGTPDAGKSHRQSSQSQPPGESDRHSLPQRFYQRDVHHLYDQERERSRRRPLRPTAIPRSGGIIAIHLDEGDELISTKLTDGKQHLFIGTKMGKAIHFPESQIREMGRTARGIRGIKISKQDEVVGMEVVAPHTQILTVTANGYGKRTQASEYRIQNRGGSGIFTVKRTQRTGDVIGIKTVVDEDELMVISNKGKIIRLRAVDIPVQGRSTQGVRLDHPRRGGEGGRCGEIGRERRNLIKKACFF